MTLALAVYYCSGKRNTLFALIYYPILRIKSSSWHLHAGGEAIQGSTAALEGMLP